MEYGKLGNTDIEVSKLCVGCMSFGKAGTMHDWTLDEAESENVIKHALDLGYNFFDTANGYSAGTSEEYLGKTGNNEAETKGSFTFDPQQPSIIVLDGKAENRKFYVGDNFVEARDIETGKEIQSNLNYKLVKKSP